MLTTIFFAFLSGVVTVASPCVLPVLPFLLSGAIGGRLRPYGIVVGFALSFTLFTLFLSGLVQVLGISSDVLRLISVGLLFVFGLLLLVPWLHTWFERVSSNATSSLSGRLGGVGQTAPNGFAGGVLVGATLGALWTPCVGPIMASVITLALSNQVGFQAVLTTLAFSLGTSVSMLAVMLGGRGLLARAGWLMNNLSKVQRGFGLVLVVFALGMGFNLDRSFQTWVLDTFPGYSDFLVGLESLGSK